MRDPKWDWRGVLPYLPRRDRYALVTLYAVLILSILGGLWAWQAKNSYDDLLVPLFFQQEEIAPIRADTVGYRAIMVEVPLRWGFGVHVGEAVVPEGGVVVFSAICVVLGWAALLTAVTRMQGFLPYLIYFAWAAWVFMAEAASTWAGVDPFYIVSLAIALVGVFPVYLGQTGLWRRPMGWTFLLVSGIIAALMLFPAFWRSEVSLVALIQPWVAYPALILFAGALVVALNAPLVVASLWAYIQERTRLGIPLFVGGTAVILLLSVYLFVAPKEIAYEVAVPVGLFITALGFFFIQPYFPSVAGVFSQPVALLWAWAGLGMVGSGGLLYHGPNHEYMFIYRVGEVMRLCLAIGLPLGVVYSGLNFWPLWRAKKGFYWDLTKSLRMGLAVYYFGLIALLSFFEARNDWPTARLGLRLYASVRGDQALLRGDLEEALSWYQRAILVVPEEAKANYNLARLEARSLKDVERSSERYEKAFLQKPFLPAALQASLVWLAGDRPVAAIQALQRYTRHAPPAAPAYNMLAYAFYRAGYLDSAAYYWKEAIATDPSEPLYYLNLALLYARYGKPTWATKALESLPYPHDPLEGLCDNLLYLKLLGYHTPEKISCISSNAQWLGEASDTTPVSRFMQALGRGDMRMAESIARYLAQQDAERRPAVMRLLGLGFWKAGHARRAAEAFLAGETPLDSLYAAYAYGDAGCLEMAFQLASRLGALYTELEKPARQEASILLSAVGRPSEATFYASLNTWNDLDYLRFAHLVRHAQKLNEAVIILRPFVDRGAAYEVPYLSVAEMFLSYGDTSGAIENIQAGLERVRFSVGLKVLWARILAAQGRRDSARAMLEAVRGYLRTRQDSLAWWEGYLSFMERAGLPGDKRAAAEKALLSFPTLASAQALLGQLELDAGQVEAAHQRISAALDIDPYAPALWRVYERIALSMGLTEEADLARKKPDPCPSAL